MDDNLSEEIGKKLSRIKRIFRISNQISLLVHRNWNGRELLRFFRCFQKIRR